MNAEENKIEILRKYLFKEVDLIQEIIKRMAFNSFIIKGWTVTLVVVALLLKGVCYHIWIAVIPLLIFWFLDAYFLWQERMYRELYKWVICNRLKTEDFLFDLNAYRFKDEVQSKFRIMFSITLGWFYCSIGVLASIYTIIIYIN